MTRLMAAYLAFLAMFALTDWFAEAEIAAAYEGWKLVFEVLLEWGALIFAWAFTVQESVLQLTSRTE